MDILRNDLDRNHIIAPDTRILEDSFIDFSIDTYNNLFLGNKKYRFRRSHI